MNLSGDGEGGVADADFKISQEEDAEMVVGLEQLTIIDSALSNLITVREAYVTDRPQATPKR